MLDIHGLMDELTLEEKAALCSGQDFWHTKAINRLDIPAIAMNDGPHGLRKQADKNDNLGINNSIPATCFPTYSALGCSWNTELMQKIGVAIAEECLQEGTSIILGPGINIKRSPLCGRNFEYLSEDPYLAGNMAASFINGVQSKGVGVSLKHFAVNNQECRRMLIDAIVDERALREIYLTAFEKAVKQGKPWTVMSAYNQVNGQYCSENHHLQSDILRAQWGFDGVVMSDWGGCNDIVKSIKVGQELEMPSSMGYGSTRIVDAVKNGTLNIKMLDQAIERLLRLIQKGIENKVDNYSYDVDSHHQLARRAAAESFVLLKNQDDILPVKKEQTIALIGEFAKKPHFEGGGSSKINPIKMSTVYEAFADTEFTYASGYECQSDKTNSALLNEAVDIAKNTDVAIVFAGLTDAYESEGFDRTHMDMPPNHNELIEAVAAVNPNTLVVLQNGAPVTMPWLSDVKAVVGCFLAGQASGEAIYNILTGKENPSGKLAETYPLRLSDNSSYPWFPGGPYTVEYRESVYVGYRYYDTANKEVLFPFGYGLSYTTFEYSNVELSCDEMTDSDELTARVKVKNTGDVTGAEVIQLYVHDTSAAIFRPYKELKGFRKIWLEPGEQQSVVFTLNKRSFAYYNTTINDWHVQSGKFDILIGSSSADIKFQAQITVESSQKDVQIPDYHHKAPCYYDINTKAFNVSNKEFSVLLGKDIPENKIKDHRSFGMNNTLVDLKKVFMGRIIYRIVSKIVSKMALSEFEHMEDNALMRQVDELPIRNLSVLSDGMVSFYQVEALLLMVNGKALKGIVKFLRNK